MGAIKDLLMDVSEAMGKGATIDKDVCNMAEEVARLLTADLDMQLAGTPEQWCECHRIFEKARGTEAYRIFRKIETKRR